MTKLVMGLPERFWAKTRIEDRGYKTPCLTWTAYVQPNGYGKFGWRGKSVGAHCVAYEARHGELPKRIDGDRAVLDHLCRNRDCVNVDHMELVTNRINILRGQTIMAANAAKTHCSRGHEFTADNTYINPTSGSRHCRICIKDARLTRSIQEKAERRKNPKPEVTHCRKGHAYEPGNVRINKAGARVCLTCAREATRRYQQRKSAT